MLEWALFGDMIVWGRFHTQYIDCPKIHEPFSSILIVFDDREGFPVLFPL